MGSVVLADGGTRSFRFCPGLALSLQRIHWIVCIPFPDAKIWTKLHKIWKASLSNLKNTPAVPYQNTDTCRKLPMECYCSFTTDMRTPREVDIRGQGEWKWRFGGYSEGERLIKNMVIVRRNQDKFQMRNRGPIWNRVAVTLRQDRAGHCAQEKEKSMHRGK